MTASTLINELTLLREAARRGADNADQVEAVTLSICRQSDAERQNHLQLRKDGWMSSAINKDALAEAVRKTAKLRVEDVGGRKERPAETVQSCLNRGYAGLGSDEGLSYILNHAIKYYFAAMSDAEKTEPQHKKEAVK